MFYKEPKKQLRNADDIIKQIDRVGRFQKEKMKNKFKDSSRANEMGDLLEWG